MKSKLILITTMLIVCVPALCLAQLDFNINDLFDSNTGLDMTINNFELIWSADTYVPSNYQGRVLPSLGSKVTVEAIINASGGDPGNLKYSWFLEDVFQRNKSGYGKDSFYFYVQQRAGASHMVKLQIFNEDRTIFTERSIEIPVVEPELIIYPSNGNSHFSDQASKISMVLAGEKFSFVAKPYFFSIKKLTDLTFEWRFPGQEPVISSGYDASVLDLTISGKETKEISENNLWVSVTNKIDALQKASQTIKIQIY